MQLIIPIAGRSSRFPGTRPKWMLNHPNGNLMVAEAISGLDLSVFENINFICLKEHYEMYNISGMLERQFSKMGLAGKVRISIIEKSDSQPETVYRGVKDLKIKGPIFIKDSDNYFEVIPGRGNSVGCAFIPETPCSRVDNKSFLMMDETGVVKNIVEKRVISEYFCTGAYTFSSAAEFCQYYEKLSDMDNLYISHIIYQMILDGHVFKGQKVSSYLDWGTLDDWKAFCSRYATMFIDIDGTLVENSAEYFEPFWGTTGGLQKNINVLNAAFDTGCVQVILTTSRTSEFAEATETQLEQLGIKYHRIIYDLYHGRRIVVNDYAGTNAYPSCVALNLRRNSEDLADMMGAFLKG
jgi:hypothetical protein